MGLHELCRGAENWTFVGTMAANGEFLRILPHEVQSFFWNRKLFLVMSNLGLRGYICASSAQNTVQENGVPDSSSGDWIPAPVPDAVCISGRKAPAFSQCCYLRQWSTRAMADTTPHAGFSRGRTFLEVLLRIADSRQEMPIPKTCFPGKWTALGHEKCWCLVTPDTQVWSVSLGIFMHNDGEV